MIFDKEEGHILNHILGQFEKDLLKLAWDGEKIVNSGMITYFSTIKLLTI